MFIIDRIFDFFGIYTSLVPSYTLLIIIFFICLKTKTDTKTLRVLILVGTIAVGILVVLAVKDVHHNIERGKERARQREEQANAKMVELKATEKDSLLKKSNTSKEEPNDLSIDFKEVK